VQNLKHRKKWAFCSNNFSFISYRDKNPDALIFPPSMFVFLLSSVRKGLLRGPFLSPSLPSFLPSFLPFSDYENFRCSSLKKWEMLTMTQKNLSHVLHCHSKTMIVNI
jgi:hypothetical protein